MNTDHLSEHDQFVVESFWNFLAWGENPSPRARHYPTYQRAWSPAVWAYTLGATQFCPPLGTL